MSRAVSLDRELRANLEALVGLIGMLPAERLEQAPENGWSARQVLAHLADFELIAAVRVRAVLTLDRPMLVTYGQDEFTERFAGVESAEEALERFSVNRRATIRVLQSLAEADWDRAGVHPVRGEETLRRIVQMMARHDEGHLAQLRAAAD